LLQVKLEHFLKKEKQSGWFGDDRRCDNAIYRWNCEPNAESQVEPSKLKVISEW